MLKSLAIGQEAELELITHLNSIGMKAHVNQVKELRYDYDVLAFFGGKYEINHEANFAGITMDFITFEVKNDVMATRTGNVAIEYFNSKQCKPSGIYVTKAKWWVHKIDGILWVCEVEKLINFTKTEKADKMIVGGGDKNADLFIYRVDRFTDICRDLKTMVTPEEFL